tara:strand:- start:102 stop:338 length:237 start_codon:yes stop_codon:yes gene_type:complete
VEEILKLKRQIKNTLSAISLALTSGAGVDNFESYKYMLGQINAYEAILQEISNLLEKKEQYEKHTGNVIDIKDRHTKK